MTVPEKEEKETMVMVTVALVHQMGEGERV